MEKIKEVDVRGLFCPTPLTFVSKELNKIAVGEKLKIIADAPNFDKDLKIWCHETGNKLLDLKKDGNIYTAIIERGKGWHGDTLIEKIKFYAIGVKLHLLMYLLEIFKSKKPKYLISFISIPEGFRAIDYLKEKGEKDFIVLPVPNEIYEYCGVVIGFKDKNKAIEVFKELRDKQFGVQDLHLVDKEKKYPVIEVK